MGVAVGRLQPFVQVHEAAALSYGGQASEHRFPHAAPHGLVGGKLGRVQLRVAAAQVQAVHALGQGRVAQRREAHQVCPQLAQGVQGVLVVEAEGLVPGHGNAHGLGAGGRQPAGLHLKVGGRLGQGDQGIQIKAALHLVR